jgi:uncharacterized protein YjbI with pentapeptide repeats
MTTGKDVLDQTDTYTLPISESIFWFAVFVTSVFIATLVAILILPDNKTPRPQGSWRKFQDRLGLALWPQWIVFYTLIIWSVLFFALLGSIFFIIWTVLEHFMGIEIAAGGDLRWSLLTITALTAALSATVALPFTLLRSNFTRRQTVATEQGLITDRINAAVASLGTERAVQRIGRPVTILTGKQKTTTHLVAEPDKFVLPPRSEEKRRYRDSTALPQGSGEDYFDGIHIEVVSWSAERTLIEWQNEPVAIADDERIDSLGNWEVFSETLPNMEVRIGAIYALERIARENLDFHVQIMEILCAYVRNNAPAGKAQKPEVDIPALPDLECSRDDWSDYYGKLVEAFGSMYQMSPIWQQAQSYSVRPDVELAVQVVGRRGDDQRQQEAAQNGVALDLSRTCLQGAKLSDLNLSGIDFSASHLDGASLQETNFQDCDLSGATFNGADLFQADLRHVSAIGADIRAARFEDVKIGDTDFSDARFCGSRFTKLAPDETVRFVRADFTKAFISDLSGGPFDFTQSTLIGAGFSDCTFDQGDFSYARAYGTEFHNVHLACAELRKAEFIRAEIQKARIYAEMALECVFRRSRLIDVNFSDTTFYDCRFEKGFARACRFLGVSLRNQTLSQFAFLETVFDDVLEIGSEITAVGLHISSETVLSTWTTDLDQIFADGAIRLPEGEARPAVWPKTALNWLRFYDEFQKWQTSPAAYTPPED